MPSPDLKKSTPAFIYESKAAVPNAAHAIFSRMLDVVVPNVTVGELLAVSPDLCKEAIDHSRMHRIATAPQSALSAITSLTLPSVDHATPLREIAVSINGKLVLSLLDEGSEIVVIQQDLCEELGLHINETMRMNMETANRGKEPLPGCVEMLEINVEGIRTWAHAYVVPNAPYRLLLGRPWQKHARLHKHEFEDENVFITVHDPCDPTNTRDLSTKPRLIGVPRGSFALTVSSAAVRSDVILPTISGLTDTFLADEVLRSNYEWDPVAHVFAYKKVANKVRPIVTAMPEYARIERCIPKDPLATLSPLSPHPPDFTPGTQLSQERMDNLGVLISDFLWPEEQKLIAQVLKQNETDIAWDESEKGHFRDEYFKPVIIPTIPHTPWVHRQPPIPPGIREEVVKLIQAKIKSGVYEPSNSAYQSKFFCVAKKDGSVRIVHDLQPLNRVSIQDSAAPPYVEHFAKQCAGCSIYTMMDLFVGFDHCTLDPSSRNFTTFQSLVGTLRLTVLPQGWTGLPPIFQGDVVWILQDEVEVAPNFQDDINVLGKKTRYELNGGEYEVILENPKIQHFVWEHAQDLNRVLHRLKHAGATVSGKKLFPDREEVIAVGQCCNYEGRAPDNLKVAKIVKWPACTTKSEVRGFLGTAGTVCMWIKDFATIARPLVNLTKNDTPFEWGPAEQESMDLLKDAVVHSPAICPIDYKSDNEVILAVDSSHIATGYILLQLDDAARRRPSRFSSITWNDQESRYSQAKIELYGLFRSLKAVKIFIVGVRNLTVEVDAKYIKGMINNPDAHLNATMNRWIAGILLFNFKLVHVPGPKHRGPDGLSRCPRAEDDAEDDGEDSEEIEEWLDEVLSCGISIAGGLADGMIGIPTEEEGQKEQTGLVLTAGSHAHDAHDDIIIPPSTTSQCDDDNLHRIQHYLRTLK
ncbi:Retrovirus-related Pol polyprotein from transposon 412 [Sparassis crispa]|uniref:Retrovirus-related Pol polyprotein from transposon 412 n=1 Tax=Sparassis crispa TaxID=139825 RepID=A0A401G9P7_9APHY|nr:Retrovirus-related Pol polyprotein from transposon 412 [Sparassis crispa]GBE78906.1 Retrovirus-related Pol polyprotein from transposon 412 [Sparassis crispa]